jgi:hypothetical protein
LDLATNTAALTLQTVPIDSLQKTLGLSGWALLSYHALIFGFVMILANWVTTLLYLRGWR